MNNNVSLRVYLAAHAPAEPQKWFRPSMPECPSHRWVGLCAGDGEFKTWVEAERVCGFDNYHDANADAIAQWEIEFERQKYIQWPLAWADEQIKLCGEQRKIDYYQLG